jgi:hypothetical protein
MRPLQSNTRFARHSTVSISNSSLPEGVAPRNPLNGPIGTSRAGMPRRKGGIPLVPVPAVAPQAARFPHGATPPMSRVALTHAIGICLAPSTILVGAVVCRAV